MVAFPGSQPAWPFMALPQPKGQPAKRGDEPGRRLAELEGLGHVPLGGIP